MSPGVLVKDFQNGYPQHLVLSRKKDYKREQNFGGGFSPLS